MEPEDNLDFREQIARIARAQAETDKFAAEQRKLSAEANKLRVDRWLAPAIVIFGGLGSFTAGYAAISALWHIVK